MNSGGNVLANIVGVVPPRILIVGLLITTDLPFLILFSNGPSQSQSSPRSSKKERMLLPKNVLNSPEAMNTSLITAELAELPNRFCSRMSSPCGSEPSARSMKSFSLEVLDAANVVYPAVLISRFASVIAVFFRVPAPPMRIT